MPQLDNDLETLQHRLLYESGLRDFQQHVQQTTGTKRLATLVSRRFETIIPETENDSKAFNIGSCTKIFTACAVGILVDENKVKWDDPVVNWIPELGPMEGDGGRGPLSIRDLLCHQSGSGEYLTAFVGFDGQPRHRSDDAAGMDEFIRSAKCMLKVGRGEKADYSFAYSNVAFALAGVIVEKVSGLTYEAFLKERIFEPLAMANSFISQDSAGAAGIEQGYVYDGFSEPQKIDPVFYNGAAVSAALGIWSTVEDLSKFFNEVLKGKAGTGPCILKQLHEILPTGDANRSRYRMTSAWNDIGEETYYALGVGIVETSRSFLRRQSPNFRYKYLDDGDDETEMASPVLSQAQRQWMYYHAGATRGYTSSFFLHVETQTAVVVLGNATGQGHGADWFAEFLIRTIFDLPSEPPMNDIQGLMVTEAKELKRVQEVAMTTINEAVTKAAAELLINAAILGTYENKDWSMRLTFVMDYGSGTLWVQLNGDTSDSKPLRYCGNNVHTSLPKTYGDLLENFTLDFQHLVQFLFVFKPAQRNVNGDVDKIFWNFSGYGSEPEDILGGNRAHVPTQHDVVFLKVSRD